MRLSEINASGPLFNPQGELILTDDMVKEFRQNSGKAKKKTHIGRILTCLKCGHRWEMGGGTGSIRRCHAYGGRVRVGEA
jgi:hypothetical protein